MAAYTEADFLGLIQSIQGAPLDPGGWARVNQQIANMTRSHVAGLYGFNPHDGSTKWVSALGWDRAEARNYADYYAARSITQRDSLALAPGEVHLETMTDPALLRRCEAYNEFFLPLGADHLAIVGLLKGGQDRATFGVRRGHRYGPYGHDDVDLLRRLFPFMRQSMLVWTKLENLRRVQDSLHVALERLPHGAALLDNQGRVLFCNQMAEEILRQDDGLFRDRTGRLRAAATDEDRALGRLIQTCIHAAQGQTLHPGNAVAISRPSLKRRYGVQLFPIPVTSEMMDFSRPSVGVFLSDPDHHHRPPQRFLADLFHFTPSEERLAGLLMQGLSLRECAEQLEITEQTARGYCKTIFAKTGVSRQGELVRLLFSSTISMLK